MDKQEKMDKSTSELEETVLNSYLRIGTSLYKIDYRPTADGNMVKTLRPWRFSTLSQDYGKDFVYGIQKYDGFCTVPKHIGYQRNVCNHYNLYEPISHTPNPGDFSHISLLMEHIFEEQIELGLDYISLLYLAPLQKLPILLLVSEERNTGKTTFINFIKAIFQENVTFNTNEDFRSQFNSDWVGKLVIAVDEVLLSRREDAERLKNLSTARHYKVEAKGKDRHEVEFYGKFILCSNNETCPIIIDPGETRYWVRKIHPLDNDDTLFIEKIKEEIPAFLWFLKDRKLSTAEESRMWFNPTLLYTNALDKIIAFGRDNTEKDLAEMLIEMMHAVGVVKLSFCMGDLYSWMEYYNLKADKSKVRRVLNGTWHLPHVDNALTYDTIEIDRKASAIFRTRRAVGRYYTISLNNLKVYM